MRESRQAEPAQVGLAQRSDAGPLATRLAEIEEVFARVPILDDATRQAHEDRVAETFQIDPEESAGSRGAEAILKLLAERAG